VGPRVLACEREVAKILGFNRLENRSLLVNMVNAQEAREAIQGSRRMIDSEDPKSALGNIRPVRLSNFAWGLRRHCPARSVRIGGDDFAAAASDELVQHERVDRAPAEPD
jgi:hypothetical protein